MVHRTIPQFCKDEGLSRYQVDRLIAKGDLTYFPLGSRKLIPDGAWEEYIQRKMVQPCQDETKDLDSAGSKKGSATTLSGPKMGAAVSAALAQRTVEKLKSSLQSGSASDNAPKGHVIQAKFS